jgi:hypothetical protein
MKKRRENKEKKTKKKRKEKKKSTDIPIYLDFFHIWRRTVLPC